MPAFPKPRFEHDYDPAQEIDVLTHYRRTRPGRDIPARRPDTLLIASWNIANLGLQKRRDIDYRIIAEMISWFDLVALQEVNDNLEGLRAIQSHLPDSYQALFSDKAGNNERLTFLYDVTKVKLLEKVGEIAIPPSDHEDINLENVTQLFVGFDRNPYLASFTVGDFRFMLVNVHLYYGDDSLESIQRRSLETYAVARWADLRRRSKYRYADNIIVLGDFNLPKVDPDDAIYKALTKRGLQLPDHSTEIGSSISTDAAYDQIAFFPGPTKRAFTGAAGVFDFDGALFGDLWESRTSTQFNAYMRYYISDHRLLWSEFALNG